MSNGCEDIRSRVLLCFNILWPLPCLLTPLATCREATETAPDTLNRGLTAGGSLQNVPEMTYWVLCCICLVYRHGCPLGRTQWGHPIGPASHTLGRREASYRHAGYSVTEALPECPRDVRGISLRRAASPRGGVCDFELMDRSWSARDEEPTLWHTYLEAQSLKCCVLLAAGRFGVHLSALPLCSRSSSRHVLSVVRSQGRVHRMLDHSNTRV